jgi:NhaP-type Na+/H+ or K+/H+ antiporter/mannitol/fructose-specific phosphotransferase system IIA component (Ntr-type)
MDQVTHGMLMTLVMAISAGILLIVLSRRLNISAIVLLLLGGVLLGPEGMGIVHSEKLGNLLSVIVSLAVGLILFEGGLTLDLKGYQSASGIIRRLLSVGVLVTWIVTAALIWVVFHFDLFFCFLAASLVIVTGPTVIAPLLKRIKVKSNLHSILHWEGVLIDPVGVFIAILCYEWIGDAGRDVALAKFLLRFIWGLILGVGGGLIIYQFIKRRWVPDDMINAFALGAATLVFGCAEALFSESGLLAVTVAGFVLGVKKPGELKEIRQFKAEITDLLIGTLFILLAARLELRQFAEFGWQGVLIVLGVMFLVRPLNILACGWRLGLPWRERVFLSWVAPRGIVAASMASLFSLNLAKQGVAHAAFIETFVYSVIVATVLIQGFTAGPLAKILGLQRPDPTGWLIVGAHALGRSVAHFLNDVGQKFVVLVDTNLQAVAEAQSEGLVALQEDARDIELEGYDEIQSIGSVLALTDNEDLNMLVCQHWGDILGRENVHYWCGREGNAFAGHAVWVGLPKPSVMSGELDRGEAVVMHLKDPQRDADNPARYLLGIGKGHVHLSEDDFASGFDVLLLRREAEYLVASMRPRLIMRLDVDDWQAVLTTLVAGVVELVPNLSGEEILSMLIDRENIFPSALGHGVAVPHIYSDDINFRICAFAQVPNGVDWMAHDGDPVRLVFLLISPSGNAEGHLETLAEIARLASNGKNRDDLLSADVPDGVLRMVRKLSAG